MTDTVVDDVLLTEPNITSSEESEPVSNARISNVDFVTEVRTARLELLWKATLAGVIFLVWAIILLTGSSEANLFDLVFPVLIIGAASLLTRSLLNAGRYETATWTYGLGLIATVSLMVASIETDYIPFTGILVIFVLGMLMSVQNTLILLGISYASMIVAPYILNGEWPLGRGDIFAYLLMGVAALLVIQVSGELYGIAQWALDSYRKERQTATQLHESRLEIEKSLLKQKNLTLQLQEVNVQLEEARRAAEMAKHWRGVFLANMSHELRTPLNAIIGFSDTMLNFPIMYGGVDLPGEYQADLNQIHTSGNHLLKIINDILDLSKIDAGRLELENQPVDLMPIFDGVLNTAVGLIGGKPVQLKRALPPQMPLVWGDPLRIRQVIINLYSNAAKFTDEGEIILGLEDRGSHVVISVRDTGPGIDEDSLETIFEAFKQGTSGRKQQRKGTGLGLAISRELLGLMNGQIWAESQVGVGSIFYMTLPVYDPAIHSTSENIAETAH